MARLLWVLGVCVLSALGSSPSGAEEVHGNPFASAKVLRDQRGKAPKATLRLRYDARAEPKAEQPAGELVIDVASDWVQVKRDGRRILYDFRLGRQFELNDDGSFVSASLVGEIAFRLAELANRSGLTAVTGAMGLKDKWDACDAETELGVAPPGGRQLTITEIKASGTTTMLECNGRVVGLVESGKGKKAPAALWPALARVMTLHPALQPPLAKGGAAPQRVEASFRLAGSTKTLAWTLQSAEKIDEPHPLTAGLTNATALTLNKTIAPGLGDIAAEAVAGRAQSGPPTLAAFEAQVQRIGLEKGGAAATLAMWPALNMFPQTILACRTGTQTAICSTLRDLRRTVATDAAVRALIIIVAAEQARRPADAIAAMAAARGSPHADHPALAASFALALQSGGPAMRKQAEVAGVPGEALPLHVRALQAYPYNPAYWTDLGDYFARGYQMPTAYLLYEVALALPMPEAQKSNPVLASKRSVTARIRNDYPAFFLGKAGKEARPAKSARPVKPAE